MSRLISIPKTCEKLGKGRTWLYAQIRENSQFPRPIRVGARQSFIEEELDQWIELNRRAQA